MPDPKKKNSLTSSDRNIFNTKPLSKKKNQEYIKEQVGEKPKYKPQLSDMPASVRIPKTPLKKIKEKKTGEVYASKKAMIKHEKSESKSFEKKEDNKGKKSPLKFMGNMIPGFNTSSLGIGNVKKNNPMSMDLGIGNVKKNSGIAGTAMSSLQDTFYPKNATAPGNKSPFRKISKEALAKNPARPLDKKVSTMTRKRNQTK